MLIVASGILLALGVLAYRRQLGRGGNVGLLVLRLLLLLGFAAILIGQVLAVSWVERPRRVVLLADVSASMVQTGANSAALAAAETFPLPERSRREVWRFADSTGTTPDPGRTRIARALRLAGRTRPGAVVLLSDGQDNGEGDPAAVARELGVPVHVVGFGAGVERNLAVAGVNAPAEVYAGDTVSVRVRLFATGFAGERTKVRVAGQMREVSFGPGTAEQELEFRVVFGRAGRQLLTVSAESLPGESNHADNLQVTPIDVRPARVRVLYLTNRPGIGTRFLLRVLAGQERIELAQVVAKAGGFAAGSVATEVRKSDVLILDGVAETGQDAAVWSAVVERVLQGAGLLAVVGPGFSVGGKLLEVLPLTRGLRMRTGTFTPEAAGTGTLLPWFQSPVGIDLGAVPPFVGVSSGELRPDATVWLAAIEDGTPLVVAGRAGKGKVVMVAGYPVWRWGFAAGSPGGVVSPLAVLVHGLVRYLAESDSVRFRLESDRLSYRAGERIRLTLTAKAVDGSQWNGLDAFAVVDGGEAEIPLVEVGGGRYETWLDGIAAGSHRITAVARQHGVEAGRAVLQLEVAEQSIELAAIGMNRPLLEAVAGAGGGRFFVHDSMPGDGHLLGLGVYQRRFVFDSRRTPLFFVGLALMVGVELVLRRRKGLL
uniref:VWA domain-containing protein n=1 Tax=candidate division WOR-3 bacterium TaxID=2052148 RepID=A0A7C4GB65_UNCW3